MDDMQKYIEEYRNSLKHPEAEEILDLMFFRPVAFFLVKGVYRLPITPNQISLLSLVVGLASALFLSIGKIDYYRIGALLLLGANILDCMDGQLARLQGSGTPLGRIIDGVADYVTGIAVFIALAIGLENTGHTVWFLVVASGICTIVHGMVFDYYQGEFIKSRRGQGNITADDVKIYSEKNTNAQNYIGGRTLLTRIYLFYLKIQEKVLVLFPVPEYNKEAFQKDYERMIRYWSFLGPSTNRSILIIFCLIGIPLYYLFIVLIGGNIWFGICLVRQYLASNRYHRNT